MSFSFSSKARTLQQLRFLVSSALFLDQHYFTIEEWKRDSESVLSFLRKKFSPYPSLAVRSSAQDEDTVSSSMAGAYVSVIGVSLHELEDAIRQVEESYLRVHRSLSSLQHDEILIQPQLSKVQMSGVIFTVDVNTGAPYIIINYDDHSGSTSSVTAGNSGVLKVFTFFKHSKNLPSNKNLLQLILLARELEDITNNSALDIEFAINESGVHLLQVRPITTTTAKQVDTTSFISTLDSLKTLFASHNVKFPNLHGYKAIYGIMPDWNPAEIIGVTPKPLAFSLYKELITDEIWPLSRRLMGYKDVGYQPGIISFAGKPYVDVRLSFNTFLPATLSEPTAEKLVNFYIDKLTARPELHDKVEFQVALTAYDFEFEKKTKELEHMLFSRLQVDEITWSLKKLTVDIVSETTLSLENEMKHCEEMAVRREKLKNSEIPADVKIVQLLHDTKHLGTLPFAKLARCAFIGNILLKSLVTKGIITPLDHDAFFGSIETVATEFLHDLVSLREGKGARKVFLKNYGHLRPGTYEITSLSYLENFENYVDISSIPDVKPHTSFTFPNRLLNHIERLIQAERLHFTVHQLISFITRATKYREKAKFEFTKQIDLMFRYLQCMLPHLTRDDLSFLSINDLRNLPFHTKSLEWKADLEKTIEHNRHTYETTKLLHLPPVVYLEKNFDYFHMLDDQPNFVTMKIVQAAILVVHEKTTDLADLSGKIIVIENADPGYDFIFSHNISGLITKYGGVGSHMSIRAAEFQLPAAIGCGSYLFDLVCGSKKIELNCATKQIKKIL